MGQIEQSDYRDGDIGISHFSGESREHLPRVLALTLGGDQYTGIDD